jgi:hypothetical protein
MVLRIALGGPSTDEDRSMVALELSQVPIELRERLIGELGAATIRNVVTARFLLTLLRAFNNDTARITKLLEHLDEAEVRLLRELENDYSTRASRRWSRTTRSWSSARSASRSCSARARSGWWSSRRTRSTRPT